MNLKSTLQRDKAVPEIKGIHFVWFICTQRNILWIVSWDKKDIFHNILWKLYCELKSFGSSVGLLTHLPSILTWITASSCVVSDLVKKKGYWFGVLSYTTCVVLTSDIISISKNSIYLSRILMIRLCCPSVWWCHFILLITWQVLQLETYNLHS